MRCDSQRVQVYFQWTEKVLKLIVVMTVQLCEHSKNHWLVHLKREKCMICDLYLNKVVAKKSKGQVSGNYAILFWSASKESLQKILDSSRSRCLPGIVLSSISKKSLYTLKGKKKHNSFSLLILNYKVILLVLVMEILRGNENLPKDR